MIGFKVYMRINFVGIGWEQLGISLLSAIAKQHGHQVSLAFSAALFNDRYNFQIPFLEKIFDDFEEIIHTIEREQSDVIVFSPVTMTYQWMLKVARSVKARWPDRITLFGGSHVSAVPELVIQRPEVDAICIGEGDEAFPQILKVISSGEVTSVIPNVWHKFNSGKVIKGPQTAVVSDLDRLPIFDKTIWEEHIPIGKFYLTMASRGCPYRCTYCFNNFFSDLNPSLKERRIRYRSPEHMLAELSWAKQRYDIQFIDFEDDIFTSNKTWLKKFLPLFKKQIALPFHCLTHPSCIDEELVKLLADSGCYSIQMGIQSMDESYKKERLNRPETNAKVYHAMELFSKYNLRPKVDHMFGLPGEPAEAQIKAHELYVTHIPYRIQTFWTNYLPGTEMLEKAFKSREVSPEELISINEGSLLDFYRSSTRINDPKMIHFYKSYELLFRLLTILPKRWVRHIQPRMFLKWPIWFSSLVGFMMDLWGGLLKGNSDHCSYASFYLHQIHKFFLKKIGRASAPATRIRNKVPLPIDSIFKGQTDKITVKEFQ